MHTALPGISDVPLSEISVVMLNLLPKESHGTISKSNPRLLNLNSNPLGPAHALLARLAPSPPSGAWKRRAPYFIMLPPPSVRVTDSSRGRRQQEGWQKVGQQRHHWSLGRFRRMVRGNQGAAGPAHVTMQSSLT